MAGWRMRVRVCVWLVWLRFDGTKGDEGKGKGRRLVGDWTAVAAAAAHAMSWQHTDAKQRWTCHPDDE